MRIPRTPKATDATPRRRETSVEEDLAENPGALLDAIGLTGASGISVLRQVGDCDLLVIGSRGQPASAFAVAIELKAGRETCVAAIAQLARNMSIVRDVLRRIVARDRPGTEIEIYPVICGTWRNGRVVARASESVAWRQFEESLGCKAPQVLTWFEMSDGAIAIAAWNADGARSWVLDRSQPRHSITPPAVPEQLRRDIEGILGVLPGGDLIKSWPAARKKNTMVMSVRVAPINGRLEIRLEAWSDLRDAILHLPESDEDKPNAKNAKARAFLRVLQRARHIPFDGKQPIERLSQRWQLRWLLPIHTADSRAMKEVVSPLLDLISAHLSPAHE